MDIQLLEIDREAGTVCLRDAAMRLDVGAIAKGYAVEQACRLMRENGWTGTINAGGNVRTVGTKADGAPWRIGIQHPDKADGDYLAVVNATDRAVVTSGDYQRYFEVNGTRYHHLIDPDTHQPAAYVRAVTVLANDSAMADGLSTALFLMSSQDGLKWVEQLDGIEALWVKTDGTVQYSSGFAAYTA